MNHTLRHPHLQAGPPPGSACFISGVYGTPTAIQGVRSQEVLISKEDAIAIYQKRELFNFGNQAANLQYPQSESTHSGIHHVEYGQLQS